LLLNACISVSQDPNIQQLGQSSNKIADSAISNSVIVSINQNPTVKLILNAACNFFASIDDLWMFSYH
jgi:hypothetical protein